MSDFFVTQWTVACQALLSTGFPRQEYWSGLPFPSPRYLPDSVIDLMSPALQVDSLPVLKRLSSSSSAKDKSISRVHTTQTLK